MADALQRTVRRGAALLLVPLSLLVLQTRELVDYGDQYPAAVTGAIPVLLLVGAVGYLAVSWTREEFPEPRDTSEGDDGAESA